MEKLYKVEEVAEILRLSASCIYKKVERGEMGFLKFGPVVRISEENLIDYVEKCKKGSQPNAKQITNDNSFADFNLL